MGLEPLSPGVFGTGSLCMYTSGHFEEAIRFAERTLALQPGFALGFDTLGMAQCRIGPYDEGCDAFERLLTLSNRASCFLAWATLAHALAGRRDEAAALADEGARRHPSEYVHPLLIAIAVGDRGAAEAALGAYIERKGSGFQVSHVLPFIPWSLEPPFRGMLDRLHLNSCAG